MTFWEIASAVLFIMMYAWMWLCVRESSSASDRNVTLVTSGCFAVSMMFMCYGW